MTGRRDHTYFIIPGYPRVLHMVGTEFKKKGKPNVLHMSHLLINIHWFKENHMVSQTQNQVGRYEKLCECKWWWLISISAITADLECLSPGHTVSMWHCNHSSWLLPSSSIFFPPGQINREEEKLMEVANGEGVQEKMIRESCRT